MATNVKVLGTGSQKLRNNLSNIYATERETNTRITGSIQKNSDRNTFWNAFKTFGDVGVQAGQAASSMGGQAAIVGAIVSSVGATISGVGSVFKGITESRINKLENYQQIINNYYDNITSNLASYGTQLENRDDIIYAAKENLNSLTNNMNTTYGSQFTNALQNIFFSKNDIYNSVNSIYNGNYSTFNDIGSGNVAGWTDGELYGESELTKNINNYFNNDYSELEANDLNGNITNQLYSMLIGADTTFSAQVRGYETDLKDYISSALLSERETLRSYSEQLSSLKYNSIAEGLSQVQNISEAAANRAFSGLKGSTSTVSEAILKLQKDLGDYTKGISNASAIGNIKAAIENQQLSVSQKINAARTSEQLALKSAKEQAINSWNSGVKTTKIAEREANKTLSGAVEYSDQMSEDQESLYQVLNQTNQVIGKTTNKNTASSAYTALSY